MQTRSYKPVRRASGVTLSERYLQRLCEQSFLTLWSYPHVFREPGKELADLLVVFDNHILIFSDKDCAFPNTGNLQVDWNRWLRKAVEKSAEQIWGAERWIKAFPERLYLDANATQLFPIELPDPTTAKLHRIAVARGASARSQHIYGGSGSLMLTTNPQDQCEPFRIGQIDPKKGFVHVFDDATLDIIMRQLDTISDFVSYLTKKEKLFRSGLSVRASGEEELLASYLMNTDRNGEHFFFKSEDIKDATEVIIPEGCWDRFVSSPQHQAKLLADRASYTWDRLIERCNHFLLSGKQYYGSHPGVRDSEKVHRFLARENRFRRRMLGRSLADFKARTPANQRATRVIPPTYPGDPYYIFLLLPRLPGKVPYRDYRELRRRLLEDYSMVVKLQWPDAQYIVGIATEAGPESLRSEDLVLLDATQWTRELQAEAQEIQQRYGFLTRQTEFRSIEYEYPIKRYRRAAGIRSASKASRNDTCPCGSGKKYKRCCLRKI